MIFIRSRELIVDTFRHNQFSRIDFLLNKPSTLAENLSGRGIRANLVLDGDFRTPAVAYKLNAAALGFNDIVVERLSAEGSATVKADRILIPVNATAARITGLNATAGELLTNVRLNGDIAVDGPRILSDNLRIRSDRLQAEALIIANLDTGLYTGALQGQLNNYRIDSVGVIDINTQADLRANNQGGFTLGGKVRVRTTQIFNESARDFLGGVARPRSWRAAYYWASMAAAAGDASSAALRDDITETMRLRGDAAAWAKESKSLDNGVLRDWIARDVPALLR